MTTIDDLLAKHGFDPPALGASCGSGWLPLMNRLLGVLQSHHVTSVDQIKTKFGQLRVYVSFGERMLPADRSAAEAAIREAEATAAQTCQACGAAPVTPTGMTARCASCAGSRL